MVPWKTPLSWPTLRTIALILGTVAAYACIAPVFSASVEHKYVTSITEAAPFETFEQPWGLTFDSAGNLYLADAGASAIDIFNSSNGFTSRIGKNSPEGFVFPEVFTRSVAVSNITGDVYVAESGTEEVFVFRPVGEGKYEKLESKKFGGFMYVAVDNSSGPRGGDVYVMSSAGVVVIKPNGEGKLEEKGILLKEQPEEPFSLAGGSPLTNAGKSGLAVNAANGEVYIANPEHHVVDVYGDESTAPQSPLSGTETPAGSFEPVAVGVDSSTGEVYVVDNASHVVDEFNSNGKYLDQIAEAEPELGKPVPLVEPLDVAINSSGEVYVSDAGTKAVDVYGPEPPSPPQIEGDSVSEVTSDSATLNAEITPKSESTRYRFEYGVCASPGTCAVSGYEHSVPETDAVLAAGFESQRVSAHVQGLLADTTYHFKVLVENEISNKEGKLLEGQEETFTTRGTGTFVLPDGRQWEMVSPPEKNGALFEPIGTEGPIQAAADGAAIAYLANTPTESEPRGNFLTQVLSTRPGGSASSWQSRDLAIPHSVPTGLKPGEGEEYRFFSEDLSLAVVQPFGSFVSLSPDASEQTSYLNNVQTDAYIPLVTGCPSEGKPCEPGVKEHANVPEGTVFGVAEDGRVCPPELFCGPEFVGGTPDAGHVVLGSNVALTTAAAPSGGLYEWSSGKPAGEQLQLLSLLPPNTEGEVLPASGVVSLGLPSGGYSSHDDRHAVSDDGSRVFWSGEGHLYMRDTVTEKTLQLDIPEPECPAEDRCGEGPIDPEFQMALSDGSKAFFTDTQKLTADGGEYAAARNGGPGGADLYECEIREDACRLHDLAPSGAVLGLVSGASEDGSWVYFVANADLAPGAVHGTCPNIHVQNSDGACNLYVHHDGVTSLVAVLSAEDSPDWGSSAAGGSVGLSSLTGRVSSDGEWLAFMSQRSLTGYDNRDAVSGRPDEEVYLYSGGSGRLVCASCDPTGARPRGVEFGSGGGSNMPLAGGGGEVWGETDWLAANVPAWSPYRGCCALHQSRYLSDSGRLFFDSRDGLVPKDVNGTEDVYEFEPEGVPEGEHACTSLSSSGSVVYVKEFAGRPVGGCVGLVSSGGSAQESAFLDASESGGDVFFLTTAKLAPQDFDDARDVYDAQECTSSAPCLPAPAAVPPACATEASCKAAPSSQPEIFGLSGSATFSGAGNLTAPSPPAVVRPRTAAQLRAERLARALKLCKKDRSRKKRAVCERRARKRYGALKVKKAKKAGNDRRVK